MKRKQHPGLKQNGKKVKKKKELNATLISENDDLELGLKKLETTKTPDIEVMLISDNNDEYENKDDMLDTKMVSKTSYYQEADRQVREMFGEEKRLYSSKLYKDFRSTPFNDVTADIFATCPSCRWINEVPCPHLFQLNYEASSRLQKELSKLTYGNYISDDVEVNQIDFNITSDMPTALGENFVPIEVEMQGNCFYDSISVALINDPILAKTLRRCCLLEFERFKDIYAEVLVNCNMNDFEVHERLSVDGAWANDFSIYIMSKYLRRKIVVFRKIQENDFPISYNFHKIKSPILYIYHQFVNGEGFHFVPLFPKYGSTYGDTRANLSRPLAPFRGNENYNHEQHMNDLGINVVTHDVINLVEYAEDNVVEITQSLLNMTKTKSENNEKVACTSDKDKNKGVEVVPHKLVDNAEKYVSLDYNNTDVFQTDETHSFSTASLLSDCTLKKQRQFNDVKLFISTAKDFVTKLSERMSNKMKNIDVENEILLLSIRSCWVNQIVANTKMKNRKKVETIADRVFKLQRFQNNRNFLMRLLSNIGIPSSIITKYNDQCKEKLSIGKNKPDKRSNSNFKGENLEITSSPTIMPFKVFSKNEKGDKNKNALSEDFTCELTFESNNNISVVKSNDKSRKLKTQVSVEKLGNSEIQIETTAICKILQIDETDLSYIPPLEFCIQLSVEASKSCYDYSLNRFISGKWPSAVNIAFGLEQKTCSFIAESDPYYYKKISNGFCRIIGKCGGQCALEFVILILEKPIDGNPIQGFVKSKGAYHLNQKSCTTRQIRGCEREKISKMLCQSKSGYRTFLEHLHHLDALKLLHCNKPMRSYEVLRKIKSETLQKERTYQDPNREIKELKRKYKTEQHQNSKIPGFIHNCNTDEENLSIHMYDFGALTLHEQLAKQNKVQLHLDATGGICSRQTDKSIYFYLLLAVCEDVCSYPLAMMISENHNNVDITYFLRKIVYDISVVKPGLSFPLCTLAVCDFSYAMLHSLVNGFNQESIVDYLERSWKVLSLGEKWPNDKICVCICASHLIKSVERNLSKKSKNGKISKQTKNLALNATARLQECYSLKEVEEVSRIIIQVFGWKQIPFDTLVRNLSLLKEKKLTHEDTSDENIVKIKLPKINKKQIKLLREKSKFYQHFKNIRAKEIECEIEDADNNIYYCPTVIDVLEKDKIPMLAFWSSAIPRKAKYSDFLRVTNSAIESEFKNIKTCFLKNRPKYYADFVRELFPYYNGRIKEATSKCLGQNIEIKTKNTKVSDDEKPETWYRRRNKKSPGYFSKPNIELTEKKKLTFISTEPNVDISSTDSDSSVESLYSDDNSLTDELKFNASDIKAQSKNLINKISDSTVLFRSAKGEEITRKSISKMILLDDWLGDEHIDIYISHLQNENESEVYVFKSLTLFKEGGKWSGICTLPNSLPIQDFPLNTRFIMHPIRLENHWFLLVLDLFKFNCTIYDSAMPVRIFQKHRIAELDREVIPELLAYVGISNNKTWQINYCETFPQQYDGSSCGIYVLYAAKCFILSPLSPFIPKTIDPVIERYEIIRSMLQTTEAGNKILDSEAGNTEVLKQLLARTPETIEEEELFLKRGFK